MQRSIVALALLFGIIPWQEGYAFFPTSSRRNVRWYRSYEEARLENKPLLVYLSGNNLWAKKLEKEIFADTLFQRKVGKAFSLVQVKELPKTLPFSVEAEPIVLLIDQNHDLIGTLGFLPISPEEYADFVLERLGEYHEMQNALRGDLSSLVLEKLYEKAKALGCPSLEKAIFSRGIVDPSTTYFLLEKYRELQGSHAETLQGREHLRGQIIERDPNNVRKSFYRLALLDFQYLVGTSEKSSDPKKTAQPLTDYVTRFPEDDEHGWKVEMMVSQYFFTKGLLHDALLHARSCYKKAPLAIRKEVARSIQHIRGEIREEKR
ncbi:MAG: hypothetical protein AAGI90_02545 [Chlamydiota bacterium]